MKYDWIYENMMIRSKTNKSNKEYDSEQPQRGPPIKSNDLFKGNQPLELSTKFFSLYMNSYS